MGVQWMEHAGKRILYVDYSGCTTEEEMLATYELQAQQMRLQPSKSLVLSNFTGASVGSAYMKRVSEGGKSHGSDLLEKSAFVGITGLKNILLDGYASVTGLKDKIRTFDSEAEAFNWLVE